MVCINGMESYRACKQLLHFIHTNSSIWISSVSCNALLRGKAIGRTRVTISSTETVATVFILARHSKVHASLSPHGSELFSSKHRFGSGPQKSIRKHLDSSIRRVSLCSMQQPNRSLPSAYSSRAGFINTSPQGGPTGHVFKISLRWNCCGNY